MKSQQKLYINFQTKKNIYHKKKTKIIFHLIKLFYADKFKLSNLIK